MPAEVAPKTVMLMGPGGPAANGGRPGSSGGGFYGFAPPGPAPGRGAGWYGYGPRVAPGGGWRGYGAAPFMRGPGWFGYGAHGGPGMPLPPAPGSPPPAPPPPGTMPIRGWFMPGPGYMGSAHPGFFGRTRGFFGGLFGGFGLGWFGRGRYFSRYGRPGYNPSSQETEVEQSETRSEIENAPIKAPQRPPVYARYSRTHDGGGSISTLWQRFKDWLTYDYW